MKLLKVQLVSSNLEAQRRFYGGRLGLEVIQSRPDTLGVQVGQTELEFVAGTALPGPYHLAFDVPEHRFAEAALWIRARVPLLGDGSQDTFFSPSWNAHMLYFTDADGSILELIARHTRPSNHPGGLPFGASSLLRVSEVGVAVPDVPAALRTLRQEVGLEPYLGGDERFAPSGSHDGLCIVVQTGRPWFPTDRAAVPLPMTVVAQTPRTGTVLLADGPVQITGMAAS